MATWKKLLQEGLSIGGSSNTDVTNNFITVSDSQTPTANTSPVYLGDTLTFAGGGDIDVTENAGTVTISFTATAESNSFGSVATESGTATSQNANDQLTITGAAGIDTSALNQTVTIKFDFNELTATLPASGDTWLMLDSNGTTYQKSTTDQYASFLVGGTGSGLTASSGQLFVDTVALGTGTSGNYASEVTAGANISVGGAAGEGTSFSVALATNVDVAGTLDVTGAATFDSTASISGNLTVGGDLNIAGEINRTSVTELQVTDKTISVAIGATNTTGADQSGLVVDVSGVTGYANDASILYNTTGASFSEWKMTKSAGTTPKAATWVAGMAVGTSQTDLNNNYDAGIGSLGWDGTNLYIQTA